MDSDDDVLITMVETSKPSTSHHRACHSRSNLAHHSSDSSGNLGQGNIELIYLDSSSDEAESVAPDPPPPLSSCISNNSDESNHACSNSTQKDTGKPTESFERCPICLATFKNQEIGVPVTCDHCFCLKCLTKWVQTNCTCPVDRKIFKIIEVKENIKGKIIRKEIAGSVPVKRYHPDDVLCTDPGCTSHRHEEMVICSKCLDFYHICCLLPVPLAIPPPNGWICYHCLWCPNVRKSTPAPSAPVVLDISSDDSDVEITSATTRSHKLTMPVAFDSNSNGLGNVSILERQNEVSLTLSRCRSKRIRNRSTVIKKATKRRRKGRKNNSSRCKIIYVIDNVTGEAVPVKKKTKVSKKKHRKRRIQCTLNTTHTTRKKCTKERLAIQLGICGPGKIPYALPYMKVVSNNSNDRKLSSGADMFNFHLIGDQLNDYLSGSEDENLYMSGRGGTSALLVRHCISTLGSQCRVMRRKAALVDVPTITESTDILGSILDAQEKILSPNAVLSVSDSSGTLIIEEKQRNTVNRNKDDKPDMNSYTVRQTPYDNKISSERNYSNQQYTVSRAPVSSQDSQASILDPRFNLSFNSSNAGSHNSNSGIQLNIPYRFPPRTLDDLQSKNKHNSESNSSLSGSDVDIYSDIENEQARHNKINDKFKPSSFPAANRLQNRPPNSDDESELDMVIDTEKNSDESKENCNISTDDKIPQYMSASPSYNLIQDIYSPDEPTGSSPNQQIYSPEQPITDEVSNIGANPLEENVNKIFDEDDSRDGCPNVSIYSRTSKSVALTADISLPSSNPHPSYATEKKPPKSVKTSKIIAQRQLLSRQKLQSLSRQKPPTTFPTLNVLYSDEEDENVVKTDTHCFAMNNIKNITEDILSEEERSYTPLLDEKIEKVKVLEVLGTELISDEDRNEFDESREIKTASDGGDALEINAKESEFDFTKPEDTEYIETHKQTKDNFTPANTKSCELEPPKSRDMKNEKDKNDREKKESKSKKSKRDSSVDQGDETKSKPTFKKLSRTTRERNYRDKYRSRNRGNAYNRERSRSRSPERSDFRSSKKKKRKELQRYNVRALIAEKPRPPPKDQFGRDLRRSLSRYRNRSRSRSYTPPPVSSKTRSPSVSRPKRSESKRSKSVSRGRSPAEARRSVSKQRSHLKSADKGGTRKRTRSYNRRSTSSSSKSDRRNRPKHKKRKRSTSKSDKRKKSKERYSNRSRKLSRVSKSLSRTRIRSCSKSPSPKPRQHEWTPTFSRSSSSPIRGATPSWTPPRVENSAQNIHNQNLTVILNNETGKKRKKEKRTKDKRVDIPPKKRRERERTPPPSKEVFASGDNILVSVSFGNENETRENITTTTTTTTIARERKKKESSVAATDETVKKKKEKKMSKKDIATIKPIAIIDLERSPYQEIPVTDDVIVLSDSDSNEKQLLSNASETEIVMDRSTNYNAGPKTPPEPSVKFALLSKPSQLRAINNPLHDPEETIEGSAKSELHNVSVTPLYKGPNTPPEPPMSPTSPDAYDPSKPTKSRSPTPQPNQRSHGSGNDKKLHKNLDNRSNIAKLDELSKLSDGIKSLTPPIVDTQTTDSQSSIQEISEIKSPEQQRIGVVINQIIQPASQAVPYNTASVSVANSSSNLTHQRMNVSNLSTITTQTTGSQRIVLPSQNKVSPVKISPVKATTKSSSSKSLQTKSHKPQKRGKAQNGNGLDSANAEVESPYSPGSSDYEDLFEPPKPTISTKASDQHETVTKTKSHSKSKSIIQKHQSTFDALFGPSNYSKSKNTEKKSGGSRKATAAAKTKQIGVKVDEDCLKILEELPNSAVEMQVKDKFLKKLNRQERVVEEVKLVLKPYYNKKKITKDEYKDIMRRAVPKICHNKSGEINPIKIRNLIEAYVKKIKHNKKVTSSSSVPQKVP